MFAKRFEHIFADEVRSASNADYCLRICVIIGYDGGSKWRYSGLQNGLDTVKLRGYQTVKMCHCVTSLLSNYVLCIINIIIIIIISALNFIINDIIIA